MRKMNRQHQKMVFDAILGLVRSLFPQSYSELCPYKRFKFDMTCNIENIIGWYVEVIKCFTKEIVQYQELKASYYNYLFKGNYSEAALLPAPVSYLSSVSVQPVLRIV